MSGRGGGYELKNTLKLGWQLLYTVSSIPYNPFRPLSQVCIKCKFCNIIQCPFSAAWNNAYLAGFYWPWPIEIFVNFLLAIDILYLAATLSTSGVGSTPGNNTKNIGILLSVYAKV